ncbi:TetR/AcrR family transcriptional regulator [Streptomyces sp. 769]|uniref:TetR/AcrR family transcriptional regulator n=1 Tax=Streptomyces sp. 769 TaxID=1262452 RepID=UPI00058213B4|nr:TetR/AcrR family transcriptional regulator [Streptomyces sp. 769]AJC62155.1 TetR family transcriptional regulator [Streptomyces sp. 769]
MPAKYDLPQSGRRAEAARNDHTILVAAREVFTVDPQASMSTVAQRAGVGVGALYRRYRSRDELVERVCTEGMQRIIDAADAMLNSSGDPWATFVAFMHRCLLEGTGALLRLAGSFTASETLLAQSARVNEIGEQVITAAKSSGCLRPDITTVDLSVIFEQLRSIDFGDPERTIEIRNRHLAIILDGLRGTAAEPLPGPAPTWTEAKNRWQIRP